MSKDSVSVRRATVEDLGSLRDLWARQGVSATDLDKHFTDFQVAVDESNGIRGGLGLRIANGEGCVYGEFTPETAADSVRQALRARVQTVARNHGLIRLWTCLDIAEDGELRFGTFPPELETRRPPGFDELGTGEWRVAVLREESAAALSLEQELRLFQEAQKESTERVMRHARKLRWIAYCILGLAMVIGVIALISTLGSQEATPR